MDINSFLSIEKKYDLYNCQIEGIHYWIYSRFSIWMMIQSDIQGLGEAHRGPDMHKGVVTNAIRYFWNSLKTNRSIKRNVDLLIFNHQRRVKREGSFECIYTEWLGSIFPNQMVCERPYNGSHLLPTRTKNLFYVDWITAYCEIKYVLVNKLCKKKVKKVREIVYRQIASAVSDMNVAYCCSLDLEKIIDCILANYFRVKYGKRQYQKLLSKTKPKVIIEVVHYSWHIMLVNELARKMGISTVEFQHGTLTTDPIPYFYGENTLIPQLPMYLYTFSDYWNSHNKIPKKSTSLIATGYPYLEQQMIKYRNAKHNSEVHKTILFISQGTIGDKLTQLAVSLFNKIGKEYHIIYKLHPGEYYKWREAYPWLADSEITVIDSSEHSIYEYFVQSAYQVAVASTAIYEGLAFQLETFIYDCEYAAGVMDLVERGFATLVQNEDDIIHLMQNPSRNRPRIECLWKTDAKNNIIQEIEILLKRNR